MPEKKKFNCKWCDAPVIWNPTYFDVKKEGGDLQGLKPTLNLDGSDMIFRGFQIYLSRVKNTDIEEETLKKLVNLLLEFTANNPYGFSIEKSYKCRNCHYSHDELVDCGKIIEELDKR